MANTNYRNLDGTTKKSFKIGANGVMISSKAYVETTDNDTRIKYLKTNQKIPGVDDYYRIAYEDPNHTIYDSFIERQNIISVRYASENGHDYVEFQVKDNNQTKSIKLYTTLPDAGDVRGPSSSIDNSIALFDGTTGKVIKDSGRVIVDSIDPLDENVSTDKSIPSVMAVNNLIGRVSTPLRKALEGTGDYLNE